MNNNTTNQGPSLLNPDIYSELGGIPSVDLKDYSYLELLQAVMGVVDEGGS